MTPREHHRFFAKQLIPTHTFQSADKMFAELTGPKREAFLMFLWNEAANAVASPIPHVAVEDGKLAKLEVVGAITSGGAAGRGAVDAAGDPSQRGGVHRPRPRTPGRSCVLPRAHAPTRPAPRCTRPTPCSPSCARTVAASTMASRPASTSRRSRVASARRSASRSPASRRACPRSPGPRSWRRRAVGQAGPACRRGWRGRMVSLRPVQPVRPGLRRVATSARCWRRCCWCAAACRWWGGCSIGWTPRTSPARCGRCCGSPIRCCR